MRAMTISLLFGCWIAVACDRADRPAAPPSASKPSLLTSAEVSKTLSLVRSPAAGSPGDDGLLSNETVVVTRNPQQFIAGFRPNLQTGLEENLEQKPPPVDHVFLLLKVHVQPDGNVSLVAPRLEGVGPGGTEGFTGMSATDDSKWMQGATSHVDHKGRDVRWLYVLEEHLVEEASFVLLGTQYTVAR